LGHAPDGRDPDKMRALAHGLDAARDHKIPYITWHTSSCKSFHTQIDLFQNLFNLPILDAVFVIPLSAVFVIPSKWRFCHPGQGPGIQIYQTLDQSKMPLLNFQSLRLATQSYCGNL
jgi:hypothetical protein